MLKKLFLILGLVAVIVAVYALVFDKSGEPPPPPPELTEVLPSEVRETLLADMEPKESETTGQPAEEGGDPAELLTTVTGNGIDRLDFQIINSGGESAVYELPAGTQFQSGLNQVLLLQDAKLEVEPGQTGNLSLASVPMRPGNRDGYYTFREIPVQDERLGKLLEFAREQGMASGEGAFPTAVLLLNADPPLGTIADFPVAGGEIDGERAPASMRADVTGLLEALTLIREAGLPVDEVRLADNEQLKLEAMVRRETHARAKAFYGLEDRLREWAYWKGVLLEGDVRLKHYALYGIGRYFPEVAVEMMPQWADNRRIIPAYRLSAVYALAYTESPDAVDALTRLEARYPRTSNMGKAVREAGRYLRSRI